jgi:hypothetical protein
VGIDISVHKQLGYLLSGDQCAGDKGSAAVRGSRVPRVDYVYARCLEVAHIPGHNRHAMDECSCCDEGIAIGASIWHMERCALLGHNSINRQDSSRE